MINLKEVADNLFWLEISIPVNPGSVNVYLFRGAKSTLVDTGFHNNLPAIFNAMNKIGIQKLEQVIITHWHTDHSGGAAELSRLGAEVFVGAREYQEWVWFLERDNFAKWKMEARRDWKIPKTELGRFQVMYENLKNGTPLPQGASLIQQGEIIQAGQYQLKTLVTPGHTPGHLCFLAVEDELLFTGDQLLPDYIPYPGSWIRDGRLLSGIDNYLESLEILERSCAQKYFPGHGQPGENPINRCHEVYTQLLTQINDYQSNDSLYGEARSLCKEEVEPEVLYMQMHHLLGLKQGKLLKIK